MINMKGHFTHLSLLASSKSTTLRPGCRQPMIPSSSPISDSSSGVALTSKTRLCGESYILSKVVMTRRRPRPLARTSNSDDLGSWMSSSISLWNLRRADMYYKRPTFTCDHRVIDHRSDEVITVLFLPAPFTSAHLTRHCLFSIFITLL